MPGLGAKGLLLFGAQGFRTTSLSLRFQTSRIPIMRTPKYGTPYFRKLPFLSEERQGLTEDRSRQFQCDLRSPRSSSLCSARPALMSRQRFRVSGYYRYSYYQYCYMYSHEHVVPTSVSSSVILDIPRLVRGLQYLCISLAYSCYNRNEPSDPD